ncbi:transposase [Nocardia salmonicida]|uniref:transposase n=1 Tax=Nocardia salmonicida TaxID=53431 RepID=UPI003CF4058E
MLTCGNGLPLAVVQSAANVNDHLVLPELLNRVRPLRGRPGRPREKIATLIVDKGYDYPRVYDELERRRIVGYIPRRGTRDKVTAGRWIVEQTLALCTNTGVWPSVGNVAPTSIRDSSTSPLR